MSFTVEKLPHEPIVIQNLDAEFNPVEDGRQLADATRRLLDNLQEKIFVIWVMNAARHSFETLLFSEAMADQRKLVSHPNISKMIFVPPDQTTVLASNGANLIAFEHKHIRLFYTLEEALVNAREQDAH